MNQNADWENFRLLDTRTLTIQKTRLDKTLWLRLVKKGNDLVTNLTCGTIYEVSGSVLSNSSSLLDYLWNFAWIDTDLETDWACGITLHYSPVMQKIDLFDRFRIFKELQLKFHSMFLSKIFSKLPNTDSMYNTCAKLARACSSN